VVKNVPLTQGVRDCWLTPPRTAMLYPGPRPVSIMSASAVIQWLRDFLLFQVHITPAVLLVAYYAGAVMIAVLVVDLTRRFHRQLLQKGTGLGGGLRARLLPLRGRVAAYAVAAFLIGELGWRMMFEFLIAYFQMHDALLRMSGN
jgi:hypothetical protein